MILGIKTASVVALVYLLLTYGSGFVDKNKENLHDVGMSGAAIELVSGGMNEAGAAVGTAAVFFGIAIPSVKKKEDAENQATTNGG